MRMEEGLDTGPMLLSESVPVTGTLMTTASTLHDTLAALGARLILDALRGHGPRPCSSPNMGVTYAAKLTPRQDGKAGLAAQTAAALDRRRCGRMTPWPGTPRRVRR